MPTPWTEKNRSKTSSASERRIAAREKSYAEAWADPGGMGCAIQFRIIDISLTGAKLLCQSEYPAPDKFILHTGYSKHQALVVWRSQNQVGVKFEKWERPYPESGMLTEPVEKREEN